MMRAVKQTGTGAEVEVRKMVAGLGMRYRLSNRDLPGSPDLANRSRRWTLFVNGCFWHGHKNCPKTKGGPGVRIPKLRRSFWEEKLSRNRYRDAVNCCKLRSQGFLVVIVWECHLRNKVKLRNRLRDLLGSHSDGRD
jgi:DNA mismatch endonuclease, patch repair protein